VIDTTTAQLIEEFTTVMLMYESEYDEYCVVCQSAVTVIRHSDRAVKSCIEG